MRMWMLMLDVEVEAVKSKYWWSTRLGRSCPAKLAIGGESGSGARVLLSYASGLTRVHKYQKSVELPEQISLLLLLLCSCSLLDSSITAPLRSALRRQQVAMASRQAINDLPASQQPGHSQAEDEFEFIHTPKAPTPVPEAQNYGVRTTAVCCSPLLYLSISTNLHCSPYPSPLTRTSLCSIPPSKMLLCLLMDPAARRSTMPSSSPCSPGFPPTLPIK